MNIHDFVAQQIGKDKADTKQVLAFFSNSTRSFTKLEDCVTYFESSCQKMLKCEFMSNLKGCESVISLKEIYVPNGFVIRSLTYLYAKTLHSDAIPNSDALEFLIEQKQHETNFYDTMTRRSHAEAMLQWSKKGDAQEATRFISMICEHLLENNVGTVTYNGKQLLVEDELTICWWLAQQYFTYYSKCLYEGKSPDYISAYSAFLRTNLRLFMEGSSWEDLPALLEETDYEAVKVANDIIATFKNSGQKTDENLCTSERVQVSAILQNATDLPF